MKRKSASFLAGVLVASMVATPLSYTNVYAEDQDVAEIVQQVEDTSGESENVQESAPAKEESKEEVKAEENATPAQPEASQEKENTGAPADGTGGQQEAQNAQTNEIATQEAVTPVQPTAAINGVKVLKNDGNIYYGTYTAPGTIAHELFHEIDYIYGLTDNGFLSSSIEKDYRRLTNIAIGYGKSVEELLYYKYPDAFYINERGKKVFYEKYRGISDIVNGASDGKVFLGYGHLRPGYWERENVLQKETFAQFGRILYDQDDDVLKMTEEIFENTSREVLERIKGMMK